MQHLSLDPRIAQAPTRDLPPERSVATNLPDAKEIKVHPSKPGGENASIYFVGTATTILLDFKFTFYGRMPSFLVAIANLFPSGPYL